LWGLALNRWLLWRKGTRPAIEVQRALASLGASVNVFCSLFFAQAHALQANQKLAGKNAIARPPAGSKEIESATRPSPSQPRASNRRKSWRKSFEPKANERSAQSMGIFRGR
jgi:hypothetical protein